MCLSLRALIVAALLLAAQTAAQAQSTTFIAGSVVGADGRPVPGATVTAEGNNLRLDRVADASGRFSFSALAVGTYTLTARAPGAQASVRIDLGSQGSAVTIALLKVVTSVRIARGSAVRGAGTDVMLDQTVLARSPGSGSLPALLLQLPGAARGANGVVHINGDHGDVNYIVDGVPVPQELNREIGTEIDPAGISFMDVLEGAYPAQYGGRFAAVVNINTALGSGPPGFEGYLAAGSYAQNDSLIGYHAPLGAGSLVVNVRNERGDRVLDPPDLAAAHDRGSNANQFVRYTLPRGSDYWNVSLSHAYQTFQIPNDVAGGEPASTGDHEAQDDLLFNLQYHHALRTNGALTYGMALKRSRIRDFGDPANDFVYGQALNASRGGSPTDCATGIVAACAYSLFSDRTSRDYTLNVDDVVHGQRHEVRAGALYDLTRVAKRYDLTLAPGNFLAPLLSPRTPGAPYTVSDDAPNTGHTSSLYLQDSWRMGPAWELAYGLRWDGFTVSSTQFERGFSQFSPRVKLTRFYGSRTAVYAYFGRFFTPFSLENLSPSAAQLLNLPLQPTLAQFDLKPQRDSDYEIGGHLPAGAGQLGWRIAQKISADLIDDTQVGVTALHQDINDASGNISTQSASYQRPLPSGGRAYFSVTHTRAVNKGCETQLLAPCFGASGDWTPADHDQRWDLNGGVLRNDARGGWFAIDGEYGSGLSSAYCQPASAECKVPPHTTLDVEKGVALNHDAVLTLRVRNLFNDRYLVTYLNAQGNHYAAGRLFEIGWRLRSR